MNATPQLDLQQGTWEEAEGWLDRNLAEVRGADDVTVADIRRRLEVLAWDCPLHYDEAVARQHGYRTIVAPATMLMTWSIPAYWKPGDPRPRLDDPALIAPLAVGKIPAPADCLFATENDTEYFEPVYPGDRISATSVLREMTRKEISVGDGAFLVIETTYRKQTGEVAGIERMTFFRYTAGSTNGTKARAGNGRPPATSTSNEFDEERELPSFSIPLTIQRLVMEAATNRDFAPIHFDRDATRATGAPDPYANTMLVQAVFEATIRNWMGLGGVLQRLSFNMSSFAIAGTIVSGHGRVVGSRSGDRGRFTELEVWIRTGETRTASGTATVWSPE